MHHAPATAIDRKPRETFSQGDRLKLRADFQRTQSTGRKVHTPHFVIAVSARQERDRPTRFGVTVTRKIANAVGRNRVKRVMREVFRRNRELFPVGCDVVVIAKSGAPELGYAEALLELTQSGSALRHRTRSAR